MALAPASDTPTDTLQGWGDCKEAVYLLAINNFNQTLLRRELGSLEIRAASLQQRLAASVAPGPGNTGSRGEVDRLRREKVDCDTAVADLGRRMQRSDAAQKAAATMVFKALRATSEKEAPERNRVKDAICVLAGKANPQGSECAEALGKLRLRTPAFFIANGLVGRAIALDDEPLMEERSLPEPPADAATMSSWKMFEHIDGLCEQAASQDDAAIEQLLSLLAYDGLQPHCRHHLLRAVLDRTSGLLQQDLILIDESGLRSAMTANWPRAGSWCTNLGAYSSIQSLLQKDATVEEDQASEEVTRRRPPKTPSTRIKASLKRQLQSLDTAFLDAVQKDERLHVTPQVVQVLQHISQRALEKVKREEWVLYGHSEFARDEPHWFVRRRAAGKVCELACEGNQFACELICQKMLRSSEHWMVRQLVVEEVCRILGHMEEHQPWFHELAEELTRILFLLPPTEKHAGHRVPRETEIFNQTLHNVQLTAERSICRRLAQYKPQVRDHVVSVLTTTYGPQQKSSGCKAVLERVLASIGGAPAKAEHSSTHASSLKKQREMQREQDARRRAGGQPS